MIFQSDSNWLALIGEADHPNHSIRMPEHLVPEIQAAFDAQYGDGEFVVRGHGTVVTVWSWPGYRLYRARRGDTMEQIAEREAAIKAAETKNEKVA